MIGPPHSRSPVFWIAFSADAKPEAHTENQIQRLAFDRKHSIDPLGGESKSVMILNLAPIALVLVLVLWPILLPAAISGYHAIDDVRKNSRAQRNTAL